MKAHRFGLFTALFSLALFAVSCSKEDISDELILKDKTTINTTDGEASTERPTVPPEPTTITDPTSSTTPVSPDEVGIHITDPTSSTTPASPDEVEIKNTDPTKTTTAEGLKEGGTKTRIADPIQLSSQVVLD